MRVLASVLIIYNALCSVHVFGLNNIFICTIRSMLNSIYTMKYLSGFEHKHRAYINHLLQIMSSYEWYMQDKACPVRKYYPKVLKYWDT